jgi:uncharacterized membrane protein YccC
VSTYSETFRALRPTTDVVTVRRAHTDLRRGLRLTLGVVVPLALGLLCGRVGYGVFAALGALPAGFAATTGARAREHAKAVLLSTLGMAAATFTGAVLAGQPWLVVGALAAAAYVAGSCGALSPRVGIATLQWPVALLLATATPSGAGGAAVRAALVLAGGSWQALLTVLDSRRDPAFDGPGSGPKATADEREAAARRVGRTLRAGLDPRHLHGQHVLRLASVAAATEAIAILAGLSHGYWAALTAVLVLKPEHASTIRRGLDRIGGTAFGVLLGVLLAGTSALGTLPLLFAAACVLCAAYTVFTANYLVFCVFLTGFVVLLLDLLGEGAAETAASRLVATALGGAIALAASHIRLRD